MCANILITGASGYVGGSILAEILKRRCSSFQSAQIHAAVRSQEQAQSLSKEDVRVIRLDLGDKAAVVEYLLSNDIDLVVNNATSIDLNVALNLITGLKARREATGKDSFFVQTTGLSAFDENTNWPFGEVKDTDSIYDLERKSADTYIVRQVDSFVVEQLKAAGITGYLIFPPTLHGRGTGSWNQLSPQLPALIRASVKYGQVYKFAENRDATLAHISDIAEFYVLLLDAILRGEQLPAGEDGHYFLVSHVVSWWDILDRLAIRLHSRGLIKSASTKTWPSDEMVAESVGVPAKFAYSMWNSSPKVLCEKRNLVGWKPVWTKERFLERLDDEIDDFLELGMPKSSLLDSLKSEPSK